jgi:hypothetical protein
MAATPLVQAAFLAVMTLSVLHPLLDLTPYVKTKAAAKQSRPQRRSRTAVMSQGGDDEDWKPPGLFSPQNAGPWAILLVVAVFQGLAALPRDDLPVWLQQAIPIVLGSQYERPPL